MVPFGMTMSVFGRRWTTKRPDKTPQTVSEQRHVDEIRTGGEEKFGRAVDRGPARSYGW
jgi:hypothetical protein